MITTTHDKPEHVHGRSREPLAGPRTVTTHLIVLGCVVAFSVMLAPRSSADFGVSSDGAPAILVPGSALEGETTSELPHGHIRPERSQARIVVHEGPAHSWTDMRELPHSLRGHRIPNEASFEALLDALRPYAGLEPYHSFEVAHLPQVVPGLETYGARLLIDGIPVLGSHVMLMVDPDSHDIRHFNALNLLHGGDRLPEPPTSDPSTALSLTLDAVGHHRAATDGHRVEHAYVKCPDAVHSVWHVGLRSASGPKEGEVVPPGEPPRIWRQVTADADVTESACMPRRVTP